MVRFVSTHIFLFFNFWAWCRLTSSSGYCAKNRGISFLRRPTGENRQFTFIFIPTLLAGVISTANRNIGINRKWEPLCTVYNNRYIRFYKPCLYIMLPMTRGRIYYYILYYYVGCSDFPRYFTGA